MRYLTLLFVLLAPPALADVTLAYEDGAGEPAFTLLIKGSVVRMETSGSDNGAVLFDAAANEMTVLDEGRRQYMVLDQAAVAKIQEQMKQALAMAEQYGMSPEAMGLDGMSGEKPTEIETGESKTVNGFDCGVYRYEVDGAPEAFACIAPADEVGLAEADWQTMRRMYAMMMELAADMVPSDMSTFDMAPPDGIAVEAHSADGGDRQVLASVDDAPIDEDQFEVPAGWKRMDMGPMGR